MEDRFQKYLCAQYKFKQVFLLVPHPEKWIPIHSPQEFISMAALYGTKVAVDKMYKMSLTKPFSFKCLTVKKRFEALRKNVSQH